MFIIQPVVFGENTIHDLWNVILIRLKQDDQVLHGAVSCADIYRSDALLYRVFHAFQRFLNIFNIGNLIRSGFHSHHDQIAVILMTAAKPVDVFV